MHRALATVFALLLWAPGVRAQNVHNTFPVPHYPTGGVPKHVAVSELSGDGNLDLAVAVPGSFAVGVILGLGQGVFSGASLYTVGGSPTFVAIGHLNATGGVDIVSVNTNTNDISLLFGDGLGGFAPPVNIPVGGGPTAVAIGDLTGD